MDSFVIDLLYRRGMERGEADDDDNKDNLFLALFCSLASASLFESSCLGCGFVFEPMLVVAITRRRRRRLVAYCRPYFSLLCLDQVLYPEHICMPRTDLR